MLEGVPDAISAAAYGLGSDRVRETLSQLAVNANAGCGARRDQNNHCPCSGCREQQRQAADHRRCTDHADDAPSRQMCLRQHEDDRACEQD